MQTERIVDIRIAVLDFPRFRFVRGYAFTANFLRLDDFSVQFVCGLYRRYLIRSLPSTLARLHYHE